MVMDILHHGHMYLSKFSPNYSIFIRFSPMMSWEVYSSTTLLTLGFSTLKRCRVDARAKSVEGMSRLKFSNGEKLAMMLAASRSLAFSAYQPSLFWKFKQSVPFTRFKSFWMEVSISFLPSICCTFRTSKALYAFNQCEQVNCRCFISISSPSSTRATKLINVQ